MAHKDRQLTSEEFMQARKDNEKRKREVTDNEDRKQGILAGGSWATCEDSVESNPQAELKSPAEYVRMADEDRQLTSEEFMHSRKDNEKRKREVTDNEARKQGILTCGSWATCEDSVESNPQAEIKSPAEYVRMAHKEGRQLSVEEFMHS